MQEPWRSHYLRAMGVDVYVPRAILPGAKLSAPCEWDEQVLGPDEPEPAPVAVASAPAAAPTRTTAASVQIETRAPRRPIAEPEAPARAAVDSNAPPRFALSVVVASSGVLVVDEAPPPSTSAGAPARTDYQRLLSNLLFALQGAGAELALEIFAWPVTQMNPRVDQSANAAREALAMFLQKRIDSRAVHTVLLLGDSARQWAAPAFAQSETLRCAHSASAWACLRDPQVKRQLWHDLRPRATPAR